MQLSRIDAIKIIERATDCDDLFWEGVCEDYYDEDVDDVPSIYDVLVALGVTETEYRQAVGPHVNFTWPADATQKEEG